jgi:primosomal protein N' (replication factor Y)
MVVHKKSAKQEDRILQCHHCGLVNWLPKICPDCGNQDLQMLGMGTQKIEDVLEELFPKMSLLRVDSDTSKNKGQAENLFAKIHSGQAQLIVGTQMLTKGHDFEQVEIVVVLDADKSLYSHDFRAIEKMFSQLVQVAGRGGRGEGSEQAKIYIQTQFPEHPLFWAIATDRHEEFLTSLVNERKLSKLPPYSYQAMIIAESRSFEKNVEVLQQIKKEVMSCHNQFTPVLLYDAVPRGIQKLAGQERAQMLLESADRQALQIALEHCLGVIEKVKKKSRAIKIIIDRDPIQF